MATKISDVQRAIQAAGAGWTAAENPVSRLPYADQRIRLGVSPPVGAVSIDEVEQTLVNAPSTFPTPGRLATIDYRNLNGKNYVTAIRDQGQCGSCVAFGVNAMIESTHARAMSLHKPRLDLSEAHLFYCYAEKEGRNCDNGWWPPKALAHVKATGVCDESCYPYSVPSTHCVGLCPDWATRTAKLSTATKLNGGAPMKSWLVANGTVSACFIVYEDFVYYSSGVYTHVTGQKLGGHCVCIIGYDDAQSCWICKNSWDDTWGEQGYFRIKYGQCGIETWECRGVRGTTFP